MRYYHVKRTVDGRDDSRGSQMFNADQTLEATRYFMSLCLNASMPSLNPREFQRTEMRRDGGDYSFTHDRGYVSLTGEGETVRHVTYITLREVNV